MKESVLSQKKTIRNLFIKGGKWTTEKLNRMAHTVDARKRISELRAEGMKIKDKWESKDGKRFKLYYM